MQFRYATSADELRIRTLWEQAFGGEQPYTDWYFQTIWQPDRTLCALNHDGKIVADLQLAPYLIRLQQIQIPVVFLVGVTTDEAYRHQGIGHSLLRETFRRLRNSPYQLALLNTDIPEYYAPTGFCACYYLKKQVYPAISLKQTGNWQHSHLSPAQLQHCDRIYRQMCQKWQGMILRTPQNWLTYCQDWTIGEQGSLWFTDRAYILFDSSNGQHKIHEIGYTDNEAKVQAVAFAQNMAFCNGQTCIEWLAPAFLHSSTAAAQADQVNHGNISETAPLIPWIMARRLDLEPDAPAEAASEMTRQLLGWPHSKLWMNEIT